MGTLNPFLTFYQSKWFKDARHESPSWRDWVVCLINVSMRRSRTRGRLSGLVNTLKNSCIDSLLSLRKSCVSHFPSVFLLMGIRASHFPFVSHLSARYSQSPILHYTCTLCCFLSPICSLHSPLSNKGWDGSPRSRWHCLFTQNREKSGMQSRCVLQNCAFFSLVWVKKRGLWRAGSSDEVGDVQEVVRGRGGAQQDTTLWEAARGDDTSLDLGPSDFPL